MHETSLSQQLGALRTWQQSQSRVLEQLRPWLKEQGLCTREVRHAIERAMNALDDYRLTVAVAGEFSRGKTELLNALFFANMGCRLLPTDAGRTTMCPTEIFYEATRAPGLRLLPIETRASEASLAALRDDDAHWHEIALDPADPESLNTGLRALTEQQSVPVSRAAELGLPGDANATMVDIPRWRLAQLNMPHPLLEQGLRILDTPGLNAIGSEPELTYEMLPAAHAVVFVVGADTGVTNSDLDIWRQYIQRPGHARREGLMVVLNKTDTLWDELRPVQQIAESIFRQCQTVAETLDVGAHQVFAVSAQKALLARVQNNVALEKRSGIGTLEAHIADAVMRDRMRLIRAEHTRLVVQAIDALEAMIHSRIKHNGHQRRGLLDLAGRGDAAIKQMHAATLADHERFRDSFETYRRGLVSFRRQSRRLLETLNPDTLDQRLAEIRRSMTGAWTTMGLRDAMRSLLEEVNSRIDAAGSEAQKMRRLLRHVHDHFAKEHAFEITPPTMFSVVHYQVELGLLDEEAEDFRNSARTTLMEQHYVTRRYFDTIVSRARHIVAGAHGDAGQWIESVMMPLTEEVHGYRLALATRIDDLRRTAESRRTIKQRIAALRRDSARLQAQMGSLNRVRHMLSSPEYDPIVEAGGEP